MYIGARSSSNRLGEITAMKRWLFAIAIAPLLVTPHVANAQQQELSVSIVGRGDDGFRS